MRLNTDASILFKGEVVAGMVVGYVYAFWWDVVMDWGLGCPPSRILRTTILFDRWYYWVAVVADFVLRFVWVFSLLPVLTNQHAVDQHNPEKVIGRPDKVTGRLLFVLGVAEVWGSYLQVLTWC